MFKKVLFLVVTFYIAPTQASLIFTVDNITTDELTFSINGTFDEDTVGTITPGVLAIKYDWTNNFGVHTDFMDGEVHIVNSTLAVDGVLASLNVDSASHSTTDSIYFFNPDGNSTAFAAGTTISGSATLSLLGGFDPNLAGGLELLSGYSMVNTGVHTINGITVPTWDYDWARLEATAQVLSTPLPSPVSLPATLLLIVSGLIMLAMNKARSQVTGETDVLTPMNA